MYALARELSVVAGIGDAGIRVYLMENDEIRMTKHE
jgi:hypothetical protein